MHGASVSATLAGSSAPPSLVPFISDFLFDEAFDVMQGAGAARMPPTTSSSCWSTARSRSTCRRCRRGWIEVEDVEAGTTRTVSRRRLAALGERVRAWQAEIEQAARAVDLDVVRVGLDAQRTTWP